MTQAAEFRIGQGIDVHRFAAGRKLILGGIQLESQVGLLGHSDADVVLHALMDALLGACSLPDIGARFPNTDVEWKDAASSMLLGLVLKDIQNLGWQVVNADISVLAEKPKLAPYISEMKRSIAVLLQVEESCVGIKATTCEKLGFIGREEGMLASCVVLLRRN